MNKTPEKYRWHCHLERGDFTLDAETELSEGECLGVFGASGAGKTTLLRCIAGLEKKATVKLFNGQGETPLNSIKTTLLFQESRLFPHLDVKGNLDFAKKRAKNSLMATGPLEDEILERLQVNHLLSKSVWNLSGGERKRVALAQLLLVRPRVLLLDEALSFLDGVSKQLLYELLDLLKRQYGISVVLVSHDLQELCKTCDRVMLVEAGRVEFCGAVNDLLTHVDSPLIRRPEHFSIQPFVSIPAQLEEYDEHYGVSGFKTENGQIFKVLEKMATDTKKVFLKIDANQVSLLNHELSLEGDISILNEMDARIESVVSESENKMLVLLDMGGDKLLSQISRLSFERMKLAPGARVKALVKAASIVDL